MQPWTGGVPDPALDGGGPDPALDGGVPDPALDWGGVPIQPWRGGTPTLDGGVPHLQGGPSPGTQVPPPQNSKHLLQLRGRWCASCVHAGGLSCLL